MAGEYKRLIFVNRYYNPDRSATSQLLTQLTEHLAASGARVIVLTSRQLYDDARAGLRPREEVRGVDIRRLWTTSFGRGSLLGRAVDYLTFYLSVYIAALRMLRSGDCVIAKTDPPLVSVVVAAAAHLRRATMVNWVQDLFPEVAVRLGVKVIGYLQQPLVWLRNTSIRRSRWTVVLSEGMKSTLTSQGIRTSRVIVIPNWSDGAKIVPLRRDSNTLRSAWGLGDRFVVVYSGNMGRAHCFEALLEAIDRLKDDDRFRFVFIGGGAKREKIERFVRRGRLENVVFRPLQDEKLLPLSLSLADLHVTSLIPELEGTIVPSKVYGILAAGRPLVHIGDPKGEVGSLVAENDCGFAVAPRDGISVVRYILQLHEDVAKRERQGQNARNLFERRFDKSYALGLWRDLLMGEDPPASPPAGTDDSPSRRIRADHSCNR